MLFHATGPERDHADDPRLAEVRQLLGDPRAERPRVVDAVESLCVDQLLHHDVDIAYLNMLYPLRKEYTPEQILGQAVRYVRHSLVTEWEFWSYANRLGSGDIETPEPVLEGWDVGTLRALVEQGRGVIVACHHVGPYRYLPSDLALQGFELMFPLDPFAEASNRSIDAARANPRLSQMVQTVDARSTLMIRSLMRRLRAGGIVLTYVDGNLSPVAGGSAASDSSITMMDTRFLVKRGVARLSLRLGVPILPCITRTTRSGAQRVFVGAPILPETMEEDDATPEEHEDRLLGEIYRYLEETLCNRPYQWARWRYAHAMRDLSRPPAGAGGRSRALRVPGWRQALAAGRSVRLDDRRAYIKETERGLVVVDAYTFRAYPVPAPCRSWITGTPGLCGGAEAFAASTSSVVGPWFDALWRNGVLQPAGG